MKKRKQGNKSLATVDSGSGIIEAEGHTSDNEENQGFGNWIRSSEGIEYMRLFVIANSFVVFLTMTWPQITQVLDIIGSYFNSSE